MRLLVISHSLVQPAVRARWRRLAAANPNIHVRLLIPRRWVVTPFGNRDVLLTEDERDGNFEVRAIDVTSESNFSRYFVRHFKREIRNFNPDVIFPVHESFQTIQTIIWRWIFAPRACLPFFTMSVHPRTTRLRFHWHPKWIALNILRWTCWALVRKGTDAAICHYPAIEQQIRADGYRGQILIQTQLGVNEEIFHPDPISRAALRQRIGLQGFVVGIAGRVTADKGVLDLAAAMPSLPPDVRLLVVGDGPDRKILEKLAEQAGWRDRLHLPGFVKLDEVARYMQAMDCFVLGSRTTATWTDTFPLVVAQAMATGLPVVGSDSGAIPFQLGGQGLVFPEGDVDAIGKHVRQLYDDPALRERMGQALLARARSEFCIGGMNPKLVAFLNSLVRGGAGADA